MSCAASDLLGLAVSASWHTMGAPVMASRKRISAIDAEKRAIKANRSADKAFERAREALQWLAAIARGEHPPIPEVDDRRPAPR